MNSLLVLPFTEVYLRDEWLLRFSLLLIVSCGVSLAYKSSHFNFGMSGQMALGAFLTVLVSYFITSQSLVVSVFFSALLSFVLPFILGSFLGYLSYRIRLNEFLSTWMLSQSLIPFIEGCILSTNLRSGNSSRLASFKIGWHFSATTLLVISLCIWFLWVLFYYKTKYGLVLRIWAKDKAFIFTLGFRPFFFLLLPLGFSVGFMGLAGFFLVSSLADSYTVGMTNSWDMLGITSSLMVFHSPAGILFSSLFLSYLSTIEDLLTLAWGRNIQWVLWVQIFLLLIFAFWQTRWRKV